MPAQSVQNPIYSADVFDDDAATDAEPRPGRGCGEQAALPGLRATGKWERARDATELAGTTAGAKQTAKRVCSRASSASRGGGG